MRLAVRDLVGEYALILDDGQKVYDQIVPALRAGQAVEVDFAGVTIFASGFFNAAIGQLLKDFKAEDLRQRVTAVNLTAVGADVLQQVVENAKRYYAAPESYREAQRKVLQAMAEEG